MMKQSQSAGPFWERPNAGTNQKREDVKNSEDDTHEFDLFTPAVSLSRDFPAQPALFIWKEHVWQLNLCITEKDV